MLIFKIAFNLPLLTSILALLGAPSNLRRSILANILDPGHMVAM